MDINIIFVVTLRRIISYALFIFKDASELNLTLLLLITMSLTYQNLIIFLIKRLCRDNSSY